MEQMLLKILLVVLAPFAVSTYGTSYVCKYSHECPQGMVCYQNVCTLEELVPPVYPPVDPPVDPGNPGGGGGDPIYHGLTTGQVCSVDADCPAGLTCVRVPKGDRECALIE